MKPGSSTHHDGLLMLHSASADEIREMGCIPARRWKCGVAGSRAALSSQSHCLKCPRNSLARPLKITHVALPEVIQFTKNPHVSHSLIGISYNWQTQKVQVYKAKNNM